MKEMDQIMDHLKETFQKLGSSVNGKAVGKLYDFQKESFDTLHSIRFPDKKNEDWRYTPVQKLITPAYKPSSQQPTLVLPSIEGLQSYVIEVMNGVSNLSDIDPNLASHGIRIISLSEAFEDALWRDTFLKWIIPSFHNPGRAFDLLNYAFQSGGFYIHIPKNIHLERPIELRIVHDDDDATFSHPLYFIHCAQGSTVKVFERFEKNSSAAHHGETFINTLGYIHLERNAKLTYIKWQDLPSSQHLVYKIFVTQFRDSHLDMFAFDRGGKIVRNNIEVELEENNTYTSLQAAYYAGGKQSMDHQTRINHKVAYCESHELYKGIIDGQASGAFNGKVLVHKDAQKTNAFQQNDTLIVSPNALMNSKPQLEIFADDVKCSHGATIGQLDEKQVFYLQSRGLNEETSKQVLKEAFLEEVIGKIPDDAIKSFVSSQMIIGS